MQNLQRSHGYLLTKQTNHTSSVGALHEAPEISVNAVNPFALLFARLKETKASPRGEVDAYAYGEVYDFVWGSDGGSFCNRNDLGPPGTSVPTGLI